MDYVLVKGSNSKNHNIFQMPLFNPYLLKHSDFSDEVAIICPKCSGKALVIGPGLYQENEGTLTSCVCTKCGFNEKYQDRKADVVCKNSGGNTSGFKMKLLGGEVDPFFHYQLWYKADCLEGTIWAYNLAHLEVIENFIGSTDRSRHGLPNKNNSIASRLPKWMSAAKSRVAMLKCIRKLKGR